MTVNQITDNKYITVTPCDNWFFVHAGNPQRPVVYRVAAWAQRSNGEVIGLTGAGNGHSGTHASNYVVPKLVTLPPGKGDFRHLDELNDNERNALKR